MTAIDRLSVRRAELEEAIAACDRTIADAERERAIRCAELNGLVFAIQVIAEESFQAEDVRARTNEPVRTRRNLRKLVMEWIEAAPTTISADEIAAALELRRRDVDRVLSYWESKEKLFQQNGDWSTSPPHPGFVEPVAEPPDIADVLADYPDGMTLAELAEHGVTKEYVTHALQKGLVEYRGRGYRLKLQSAEAA